LGSRHFVGNDLGQLTEGLVEQMVEVLKVDREEPASLETSMP
jgi:hypothetical protein